MSSGQGGFSVWSGNWWPLAYHGAFEEAERHLREALACSRRINLVELESDILLVLARLRHHQNKVPGTPAVGGEVPGTAEARSPALSA